MTDKTCKRCWWQEGDRCYEGDITRNESGRSTKMAIECCDKFYSRRAMLEQYIPAYKLIILSELYELN